MKTIIEPFKIKMVEPIKMTSWKPSCRCTMKIAEEAPFLRHFTARFEPAGL
jgi:tryptophanase